MRKHLVGAAMIAAAFLAQPSLADTAADQANTCLNASGDLAIGACTWMIQSGQWAGADLAPVFYDRGRAYYGLGQYQKAIQDFGQAIQLKPDFAEAFNNRSDAYNVLGQYQRAIQDLDQAIGLKPDFIDAFYNRGNAYNGLGQYQRAIQDFDQAIRLKPDYANAFFNRGTSYDSLGQYQREIQDYDAYIRLAPADPDGPYARGKAKLKAGDTAGGNADIARAIAMGHKP